MSKEKSPKLFEVYRDKRFGGWCDLLVFLYISAKEPDAETRTHETVLFARLKGAGGSACRSFPVRFRIEAHDEEGHFLIAGEMLGGGEDCEGHAFTVTFDFNSADDKPVGELELGKLLRPQRDETYDEEAVSNVVKLPQKKRDKQQQEEGQFTNRPALRQTAKRR